MLQILLVSSSLMGFFSMLFLLLLYHSPLACWIPPPYTFLPYLKLILWLS